MNNLMIPPNPNWFMSSVCQSTPENGILYGAMTKLVYIPPATESASSQVRVIDLKSKLCGFSPHPNWNETKQIAVISGDFSVIVYDFATGTAIKGHRGHDSENNRSLHNQQPLTAVAFLKQKAILSSVNSNVINYCLLSNTFKVFLDLSTRNPISILKQSPKNDNMVAAGTKNGLVLLLSLDKMEVVAKLRGHDTEISSLDWMYLSMNVPKEIIKEKEVPLDKLIASTDTSDCFDIYEDNTDAEFGVYVKPDVTNSDDEDTSAGDLQEKMVSDSNFNFLEACNNLKGQILSDEPLNGNSTRKMNGDAEKEGKFADNKEQYGLKNADNKSVDESLASNASSRTPVLTEESLNYLEECQRMKDFVVVSKEEVVEKIAEIPVLASGSREPVAWLWDVNERTAFCKIKWHPKPKQSLPTPFTNVLWIDQNTLLVTDGNGELMEYKISLDANTRALISKDNKDKQFDAKGVLNMCKSEDGSFVWTSSIHRHISCLDVKKNYEKIVSLDTIQLRIHYIVENPIDSNVIAIGGNDKRICLWNTSEASHSIISLRTFMNKIQSGVLCLSWHPEKDNILAFSTREGRIGVFDVNKSSHNPTILPSFSSQEVYSIAWAKIPINNVESTVLIACNSHKLVYYAQGSKDQWKMEIVDHLKQSASIAVNGKIAAIGTGQGDLLIVDVSKKFYVLMKKKICKKYIGMMTWHEDTLAISSESGVTIVKNVNADISELPDEHLLKLQGHRGRVFAVRFNKSGKLLVSCCVNGYVKVWDLETMSAIASFTIDTLAYSAIFQPSNEDFIVCGGQDSTVLTFEWRKYPVEPETGELALKKRKQQLAKKIQWAAPTEVTTISKNSRRRDTKKIPQVGDEAISELSSEITKMNLQPKKIVSIFHHANRELTANPLELIEMLLKSEDHELTCNEKLFQAREIVKEVIENELEQSKQFNQKTQGGVILPQLNDTLKDDITKRIESKSLTEIHVAVAPSVSFDLWRKCCVAYALQCVENEDSLAAVPYFLAVNDVDNCVNQLCDGKFFREAWIIAKMRKEDSDPIFEKIMKMWTAHFDYSGNFEAGAALLVCKKDFNSAAEMLEKRQNKSEKCTCILETLKIKTV